MFIIRFIFRLTLFMTGLIAIMLIFWAVLSFFRHNTSPEIVIVEADLNDLQETSVGRAPKNLEDFIRNSILQLRVNEINIPISDDPTQVPFIVELGETATSVGERLEQMGLIVDSGLFRQFMQYNGLDATLEAGEYVLQRNMSMKQIGEALQRSRFEEVGITIPEGWRAEQIAEYLEQENIMGKDVFLNAVTLGSLVQHPLLADRSVSSYEGFLYPDTYRLPANASPEDLISRMLDNLAAKLPPNAFDLAAQQGLTFYQIMIVASIVEREVVVAEERPLIASVYLNRLKTPEKFLNADPTVQYALGYQPNTGQWWKTPVSLDEYSSVDSPYNTYLYPDLPPTPIANPGIASILAALQPAETNYLYFVVSNPDTGEHIFTASYEEHLQNVAIYQGR